MKYHLKYTIFALIIMTASVTLSSFAELKPPPKYKHRVINTPFIKLFINPEKFIFKEDIYIIVRGFVDHGGYKNLYYSKSRFEIGTFIDGIPLKFSREFRKSYDLDKCSGKAVEVIGKPYQDQFGNTIIKDIVYISAKIFPNRIRGTNDYNDGGCDFGER